jgi:predicted dehydrogenase
MESRRTFLQATAAAAVVSPTVQGANERVQVAIIGTGGRMNLLIDAFLKQSGCAIAALCDVDKPRLTQFAAKFGIKADTYGDYRRVLERKDIDAVVIATPDHWHSPMLIAASEAGKDAYVEKPVSNTIPAAVRMLQAAQKHKRVVQVGTQQRSWAHFQECAKMIQDGLIGNVSQVVVNHGSGGGAGGARRPPAQAEPIPEGFDWEMWQGPAKRYPYSAARRGWRAYYEYGGGTITDWGVHWMDIVHLVMRQDVKGPIITAAAANINPDPERAPGSWTISYQYDNFIASFVSATQPGTEEIRGGPSFYGSRGYLLVNRSGYIIRPQGGGGGARAGRGTVPAPVQAPVEAKTFLLPNSAVGERASEVVHVRNWLDCIKSRQKPTADIQIGFYSTLPCLLGLQAIREKRTLTWDPNTMTARPA